MTRPAATYILPLRWTEDCGLAALAVYLGEVAQQAEVLVVDGSPAELFHRHAAALPPAVRHLRPRFTCRNGKVAGVLTGLAEASCERIIIADDDVRYDPPAFRRMLELLDDADAVRPQNYFLALPWHARWDTGRTLLNRALGSDFPGTLGVRRSTLRATDGYDGDVLFENLELLRTVRAAGGKEIRADDLFVGRIPPPVRHFRRQRIRQAYDDFAQPPRLLLELFLLPALFLLVRRYGALAVPAVAAVVVGLAETGRRRRGGRLVFSATAALWAPAWMAERMLTVWAALFLRLTGGIPYAGSKLAKAGNSLRFLRLRHAEVRLPGHSVPLWGPAGFATVKEDPSISALVPSGNQHAQQSSPRHWRRVHDQEGPHS
ncbi:glycosyltransferase family 2 protein [Arthrobacter sp. EH-1B-1]|uniref:Glycosyltransferase family 2 protein n=1 Tax=Arthrobacter vasquezii TaxID=2977629 RepID=A0ABT6CY02_9MICC|nr:glycosyltransferase family 2 protein [Arthrobacter vasquezii]MDF9278475.1 glycosyltransferase family 2 protein [Arthrobacter vasquezii]